MKRVKVYELDTLRTFDSAVDQKESLLYWIWDARRRGVISEDYVGFFLTDEQVSYWRSCGMRWDDTAS